MNRRPLLIALLVAALFVPAGGRADDGADHDETHELKGVWAIDFKVPVSPKGNDFGQPHRHPFQFSDKDGQRIVVAREVFDIRVPGAWRSSGNSFSATFEFTCPEGITCGTIILRGTLDSATRMSGRVAIFWDTRDEATQTGLDTVTGTFTGERCGGIRPAHDTGGCDQ